MENDLTLKNSSSSILAQPNQPSPFSFSFSRAGLLRRPVPAACPQLHHAACSLGPAAPFPHRPAPRVAQFGAPACSAFPAVRGQAPASSAHRSTFITQSHRVAHPLSFSLAALRPHRSAPFPSFLSSSPSFLLLPGHGASPMESHRRRLEGAEPLPASLPYSAHHPAYKTPTRPRLLSPPLPATESYRRQRTPLPRALAPSPTSPEDPPHSPAPVGTSTSRFWPCFPRIPPQPRSLSLSSSRPPSTTSLGAFPDAAFPSRRLMESPSVFPCPQTLLWRPGKP